MATIAETVAEANAVPEPVWAMGLPLAPLTMRGAVDAVNGLIARREPSYVITANLNYAMLSARDAALREVNRRAAFVLADGMPLVWSAGRAGTPLPGRVTGSDLIFELAAESAARGHRVFLLGGGDGVGATAAANLTARYPGLNVVGVEVPPFRERSAAEDAALVGRIRDARPDILLVAFSQPTGEKWIAANLDALGVPACVQVGASIDFAAGRVRRAPGWVQRFGMEWAFRCALEPRRLGGRYARNVGFLARQAFRPVRGF